MIFPNGDKLDFLRLHRVESCHAVSVDTWVDSCVVSGTARAA